MFSSLYKNRAGQNTAEYALLIALVVAGVIAMQTYAQRALQARMHDAGAYMAHKASNNIDGFANTTQYEPYYLSSNYAISRQSDESTLQAEGLEAKRIASNRQRAQGGEQVSTYNNADISR